MKLHKILFLVTLIILFFAAHPAHSQDVVIPADSDDIEAFDKALMKYHDKLKAEKKSDDDKEAQYAESKGDEIEDEISKEAEKLKNLDEKSRDKIKKKAQADAQNMGPKGSQNPAEVVSPQKGIGAVSHPPVYTPASTPVPGQK